VENLISMYFDHNEASEKLNSKVGFKVVGYLPKIAEVFGQKRGLKISIMRINQDEQSHASDPSAGPVSCGEPSPLP
jgi:L-amino acid N-acyltransferase YncA